MLVSLGEHCNFLGGFAFKSQDLKDPEGIPIIKIKNVNNKVVKMNDVQFFSEEKMNEKLNKFLLADGDVLIAMTGQGSVGRVGRFRNLNNKKVLLNQRVGKFVPKQSLDLGYLYYILSSEKYEKILFNAASGSGQPNLSPDIIKSIKIPYLPIDEQIKVSKVLGALDDKIALNQKFNQTLEQMAQVLFKSWFVDFDPVFDNALASGMAVNDFPVALKKKAEQRQRVQQQIANGELEAKSLPEDISQLFPSEFEQTDDPSIGISGWIPKGWVLSNTDEEFGIKGGSTPSTKNPDFWEGGEIHWTSPKDLSGNDSKILLDTNRKITEAGLAKITSGLLPVDTVLMSSRAPVGYLAFAKVPVAINQGYIALLCKKTLSPEYTMQFLDSVMDEIKGISGGTTFAEISKKTFRSIKLIVPSKPVIDAYTGIAKGQYDKITENIKQSNTLTDTRDFLLPKLISGEIVLENDK